MGKYKTYQCQVEGCSNTVPFRSTIRNGPNKGKKACPKCYAASYKPPSKGTSILKRNKPVGSKRKSERAGLPEFFDNHIGKIRTCENCGIHISSPDAKNVAHILPKETFKSVMSEPGNALYLCTNFDRDDGKGCHERYDHSWGSAMLMNVWSTAVERYQSFKHKVKEKSIILLNFSNE